MLFLIRLFFRIILFCAICLTAYHSQARTLKVLTYNTWQLPLVSRDRKIRAKLFADEVIKLNPDICAFQEIWTEKLKTRFAKDLARRGLPYSYQFRKHALGPRGLIGNGLLIVSRYPLNIPTESNQMAFRSWTEKEEILARKGALHVEVMIDGFETIDFYTTHLGAVVFKTKNNDFKAYDVEKRFEQTQELATFVQENSKQKITILTGDFNAHPYVWNSLTSRYDQSERIREYQLLEGELGFTEMLSRYGMSSIRTYSLTNDYAERNHTSGEPEQDLDAIFVRDEDQKLKHVSTKVVFQDDLAQTQHPLSDHFGVLSEFEY